MDDCIVCDKCAKICPVDCIEIEPIKATGVVSYAQMARRFACILPNLILICQNVVLCLCTTVCPTECLTMKKEYDFSVFDITEHNFAFGNLTDEQADEKKNCMSSICSRKEAFKKETAFKSRTESCAKTCFQTSSSSCS
jgi:NADH-quinone oxidoreductase subunit I